MNRNIAKFLPFCLSIFAITLLVFLIPNCGNQPSEKAKSSEGDKRPASSSTGDPLSVTPVEGRNRDFPENLKTFTDWGTISAEEMESYRASLTSRVGYWDSFEIGEFFLRSDSRIQDKEAQGIFRESVLGVWCSKDVDHCLSELESKLPPQERVSALQKALKGWANQDWMLALRFLRKHGEQAIEERLGGDSVAYITNLSLEIANDNGYRDAEEFIALLRNPKNKSAATKAINNLKTKKKTP